MSPKSLLRHHAGRMAGPARWYLALLGMLSVVFLSAHFAVQEHVQKKMRLAVHAWLTDYQGSVSHVRYRLLRGELTLEKLSVSTPGMQVDAPLVKVQASSRAVFSRFPLFTKIGFEHPVVNLSGKLMRDGLFESGAGKVNTWHRLLEHAESVQFVDMTVHVSEQDDADASVGNTLQQVDARWQGGSLMLNGILDAGLVQLQGKMNKDGQWKVNIALQGVPLTTMARFSGMSPVRQSDAATATGSGGIQLAVDRQRHVVSLNGSLQLLQEAEDSGLLVVEGEFKPSASSLRMQCTHVQLAEWAEWLPQLVGRKLQLATMDGRLLLQRDTQEPSWHLGFNGELGNVQLVADGLPAWHMHQVQLKDVRVVQGHFSADSIHITDADIGLRMEAVRDADSTAVMPEVTHLELKAVRPKLVFADGSAFDMPSLHGSGMLHDKHSTLQLTTSGSDDDEALQQEQWSVQVDGDFTASYRARLTAGGVPLVRLRTLLPRLVLPGEDGAPEYEGISDFSLSLTGGAERLMLNGKAVLKDVRVTQGGASLSAKLVEADISAADTQGRRSLARLAVRGWHVQSALHPLTGQVGGEPAAADVEVVPVADAGAMPAGPPAHAEPGWDIGELTASEGRVSLGSPDAIIADKLNFSMRHMRPGHAAAFTLYGALGEGSLRIKGKLSVHPALRMTATARIRDMLPFAFNNWMHISGMPRFVRGRVDATLRIADSNQQTDGYRGKLDIDLRQALLESGTFPEDPVLSYTGFSARALLDRLNHGRRVKIAFPYQGEWHRDALPVLPGGKLLEALKLAAEKDIVRPASSSAATVSVTRIRLQGRRGFSHNERVRLRRMIRQMQKQPKLIAELVPQLGTAPLDSDMLARVRHSQQVVERYMRRFGIARKRIFPVWPVQAHQRGDAPGIMIHTRPW